MRNESLRQLERDDLSTDPFFEFGRWYGEANAVDLSEPNAMNLATCDAKGIVSSRTVLLKIWDAEGFVFFTNFGSRKSRQIGENPNVALHFYWQPLHRQIHIEGTSQRISARESLKYFATRPRGSQLGAWCSNQSSVLTTRAALDSKLQEVKRKFLNREIPLPSLWGGYRVTPRRFEFWQLGNDRLHDRFEYLWQNDGTSWLLQRLAP